MKWDSNLVRLGVSFPYATPAGDLLLSPLAVFTFGGIYVGPFESPIKYLERL
jgi:hypothetical protein